MRDSLARVSALINGDLPDRAPLFDLLRNDAVIEHFSGKGLTVENAREVVYQAYAPAIDATRPTVRIPALETSTTLEDGRQQVNRRWTSWTQHKVYPDAASFAAIKRRELEAQIPPPGPPPGSWPWSTP